MFFLSDVITYVRRLIKSPSNADITDDLIIDYINRFYITDVDARIQLFDLKTKYGFWAVPGVTSYNMPLYGINSYVPQLEQAGSGTQPIAPYPVYQGFMDPAYVNGIQVPFYTDRSTFFKVWTPYVQQLQPAGTGDGTASYTLSLPFFPAIQGHIDMNGIIASGSKLDPIVGAVLNDIGNGPSFVQSAPPITSLYPGVSVVASDANNQQYVVTDSGQFSSSNQQVGFLQYAQPGGNIIPAGNVNYQTGVVEVVFPANIADGNEIQTNCYFYEPGIPRAALFQDNQIVIMPVPNVSYYVELDAYLSPAAFLNSAAALPFAYMSEYIARGAARKILSDTGDIEQFQFYEPLFKEQEILVWKRSQRQITSTRTGTIFSDLQSQNTSNSYGIGGV